MEPEKNGPSRQLPGQDVLLTRAGGAQQLRAGQGPLRLPARTAPLRQPDLIYASCITLILFLISVCTCVHALCLNIDPT